MPHSATVYDLRFLTDNDVTVSARYCRGLLLRHVHSSFCWVLPYLDYGNRFDGFCYSFTMAVILMGSATAWLWHSFCCYAMPSLWQFNTRWASCIRLRWFQLVLQAAARLIHWSSHYKCKKKFIKDGYRRRSCTFKKTKIHRFAKFVMYRFITTVLVAFYWAVPAIRPLQL